MTQQDFINIQVVSNGFRLELAGNWTLENLEQTYRLKELATQVTPTIEVSAAKLTALDTAGAKALIQILTSSGQLLKAISFVNFSASHQKILDLVINRLDKVDQVTPNKPLTVLQKIGLGSLLFLRHLHELVSFLGEVLVAAWSSLFRPKLFRLREFFVQLERVGVDAIPIVALVTLLIGIVIAYLFAAQIVKYGANIFIVDGVSMAICRELSPLIVAIIMAGRSGSAFTAQIGTMKINEEVDALVALGLSPIHVLVIPRVLALVIAMPLLVFVGDVVGIFGGIVIADQYLGITLPTFIERLRMVLPLKALYVGLGKAPVFAIFIALIGCRMGLSVENNAQSVGLNTTSTVVQSIVSVIILNAIFAVVFQELGI